MEKDGWKTLAIVFIIISAVLVIIIIVESIFLVSIIFYELSLDEMEVECDVNICGQFEDYNSYVFDEYSEMCYCYGGQGEVLHREIVELNY